MGRIFRRRPRRRELVYVGLGIFLLNLAVSYFHSSKPLQFEDSNSYFHQNGGQQNGNEKKEDIFKKDNHVSKHGSIDTMPISVDVKQYKVNKLLTSLYGLHDVKDSHFVQTKTQYNISLF